MSEPTKLGFSNAVHSKWIYIYIILQNILSSKAEKFVSLTCIWIFIRMKKYDKCMRGKNTITNMVSIVFYTMDTHEMIIGGNQCWCLGNTFCAFRWPPVMPHSSWHWCLECQLITKDVLPWTRRRLSDSTLACCSFYYQY